MLLDINFFTNNWIYYFPEFYFILFSFFIFLFMLFLIFPINNIYYYFSKYVLIFFLIISFFLFYFSWNNALTFYIFDFLITSNRIDSLSRIFFIFFLIIFLSIFKNYLFIKTFFVIEFFLLFIFSILGLFLIFSSNDFLNFYLSLELYSLSIYGVMAIMKNSLVFIESAVKYFIISSFSSGLIIFSISVLYFFTGSINFYDLNLFSSTFNYIEFLPNKIYYLTALFLLFLGLLIKISAAPFHVWYIDIYSGTLHILNLFFLVLPKFVFLNFLLKFYIIFLFDFFYLKFFSFLFFFVSSAFFGVFGAIYQTNIRKILIYSSIFNLCFFLSLFNFLNSYSLIIFFFFSFIYFNNVFGTFTFLLSLLNYSLLRFYKNLNALINLFENYPAFSFYSAILFLSSAGLPPFVGFFSKFLVFFNLINLNSFLVFIFLFIFSIISFFYYIRFIKLIFINNFKNYIFIFPISFGNSFLIVSYSFFNLILFLFFPLFFFFLNLWFLT